MDFRFFSVNEIKNFINKNKIKINKKLGQNFLINSGVVDTIIEKSQISEKDLAIEIGCGLGALTHRLIRSNATVVGFEIDKAYVKHLNQLFDKCQNFILINKDFLKSIENVIKNFDIKKFNRILYFGNLPYYITTPILEKIFLNKLYFDKLYFMLQKEVGKRIVAKEGTKEYGSLTIFCNYFTETKIIARVSSKSFFPAPKVDSVVAEFTKKEQKINLLNEDFFFKVTKSLFINRRKQIKNNLLFSPFIKNITKETLSLALKKANIDENTRGETLSIEKIACLSNELFKILN